MRAPLVAALVVGSVAAVWAAGRGPSSEARGPSPDEARVFDALNARRRSAGARSLEWDRVSATILREMFKDVRRPEQDSIDKRIERERGFDASWSWSSRVVTDPPQAAEGSDAELLGRAYTHGAAAIFDDAGIPGYVRVVIFASSVPPLVGRHNANGPAGSYRFRCPNCRKEFVYLVKSAPGTQFICPACKTTVSPYLEDTKRTLHWPTWYVAPFAPFATTNPFLAWQWVNQKVRYDHNKADHDLPGWQTPEETNDKGTGVCRDTALMLAAWLRHAGKDARVVTGLLEGEHHAWVVLTDGETRYLLESASDGNMTRRYPPRLELTTTYLPTKMQFDEAHLWLNRGQQRTRDYDAPQVWLAAEEAP